MSLTGRERSIAAKFRRYEDAKAKAKKFYDRADLILMEIAAAMVVRRRLGPKECVLTRPSVKISEDGRKLHINQAEPDEKGILGWGHAAVRQFSLKVVND